VRSRLAEPKRRVHRGVARQRRVGDVAYRRELSGPLRC